MSGDVLYFMWQIEACITLCECGGLVMMLSGSMFSSSRQSGKS